MHALCARLGVKSSHDLETHISEAHLVGNSMALARLTKDLQGLLKVSGAKSVVVPAGELTDEEKRKLASALRTAISQVLRAFANTELRSQRKQARQGKGKKVAATYSYQIAVKEVDVEGEKTPDPFTLAAIQLVTRQPAAQLEFLSDSEDEGPGSA